ncbi:MAG: hypothetical protein JXA11_16590 [Phycisphaerae bacterium]|nr:hypothetical protein [Phycisphaerae bacterium]
MTLLGMEQIETSLRIVTSVAPVALYFLLLGILNTRRHPQLLSGRQDSALLTLALSPLAITPVMHWLGGGLPTALACGGALAGGVWLLSPKGRTWVIYNLPASNVRRTAQDILRSMNVETRSTQTGLRFEKGDGRLEVSYFPVLRNVTLRLLGADETLWNQFESRLHERLQRVETEPSPMAVTLLLLATAMIVAPLSLMVHHAPEIVRLLNDLLP